MCEPTTLAIGAGLMAASTLGSGYLTSKAQGEQANHEAGVARENARRLEVAAVDAGQRGEQQAAAIARQGSQLQGEQILAAAAGGIDLSSATFQQLVSSSAQLSELDVLTARNNARREAWGLQTEATNLEREADLIERRGRQQQLQTFLGTATQLGTSQLAGGIGGPEGYLKSFGLDAGTKGSLSPTARRPTIRRG